MIEDIELRDIYKTSSAEHIQKLEAGLLQLEKEPNQKESYYEELMREAHSLKGDSRIVGAEGAEIIAHSLEDVLGSLFRLEISLTPQLSDRLYQAIDAIAKLVNEAVTDQPSEINIDTLVASLKELISSPSAVKEESSPLDLELKQIYQDTSLEHLQKIEQGLSNLDPQDLHTIEELVQEAHSLKEDSHIIGVETVESLANCVEDLFVSLKKREILLTEPLSDRLHEGLEAMGKLINEAVTGQATKIETKELIERLKRVMVGCYPEEETNTAPGADKNYIEKTSPIKQNNEVYQIDTIRVPTKHLDTLMTQTGELSVIKIRLAHLATQLEEIAFLWEESQSRVNRKKAAEYQKKLDQAISQIKTAASENSTRMDLIATELEEKIRTLRLLPLNNLFQLFPRMVRDIARAENKEVELILEGAETVADKQILEEIKDPLMHLIRNAIDHGIETAGVRSKQGKPPLGKIWLRGYQTPSHLVIEVQDDGKGLDLDKIKETAKKRGLYRPSELENLTNAQLFNLVLEPGFSTKQFITEVSGRGVGLDVVRTNIEKLKGSIQIESIYGQGCTFRLQLGKSLATANVLLVEVQGVKYALPLEYVETTTLVEPEEIFTLEGRQTLMKEGKAVSVVKLADLLELPQANSKNKSIPCILLNIGQEKLGLFVDNVLDTLELVIKPQSKLLKRVRNVTGASILGTGEVCMILNPLDLLLTLQKRNSNGQVTDNEINQPSAKPVLLLVEDSLATRTQEKRILEGAGYEVVTAVDGLDGYNKLRTRLFEAVISDVQMPNLDGLSLTAKIRQLPEFKELPIILVTSLSSEEDKRKGAEAGANAYIVKTQFNQDLLLDAIKRLI